MAIILSSFFSSKSVIGDHKDCISVLYEPTICVEEEVRFSLKALGTCTISDINWNFGTDATIKTVIGAEPVLLAFNKAGKKDITIQYYDHEKEEAVTRIISISVIEPISQISVNPEEPCVGQKIELSAVGNVAGFYIWKGGNIPEEGISGNLEYKIVDIFTNSNQKYTLEWYVGEGGGDGGCSYRKITEVVKEKALEPIEFEQGNIFKVCQGDEVTIGIKNPETIEYNWNCSEIDLIRVGTSIKFSPKQSCEIKVTAREGECIRSGTINIQVQDVPEIEIFPKSSMICAGSSVKLKVVGAIPGETYIWSDSDNIFPINTYSNVVMVEPESSEEYEVIWVSGECTASATASVEVSNITDILEDKIVNICEGETINLQVVRPNDGTIEWSGGDLNRTILGEEIEVSPEQTTTYDVLWQNSICSDAGTITVQVNPKPQIKLLSSVKDRVCKGKEVTITAELSDVALENNFTWYQDNAQIETNSNLNELSFIAEESHNIIGEWVDKYNYCVNKVRANLYLEVIERPTEIEMISNVKKVCLGDTVHFEILGVEDDSKYILLNENETIGRFDNGYSLIPDSTTNYVAWWVDDCQTSSNAIKIQVNPIPFITINTGEEICPYENFRVKVLPDDYTEYKWTGGNIDGNSLVTGSTLSRIADDNVMIYNLKVTENECRLDTTVKINLVDISADITTNLQPFNEVCEGNAIQLKVSGGDNFVWEPANLLNDHLSDSPIASMLNATTRFKVTSYKDGCEFTEEIEIKLKAGDDCEISLNDLEIPNAITPNDDGKNDYWVIPGIEGNANFRLTIFNSTGSIIYDKHSYQNEFDGYNNGNIPEGTYYFVIVRKDGLDKRTGTLTILR